MRPVLRPRPRPVDSTASGGHPMAAPVTRRQLLTSSTAAGALLAFGLPEWILPALAQGETLVPFLDIPGSFTTSPSEEVRVLDIRRIDGPLTPRDQFYTLQHYGQPEIDPAAYRLKIAGLVDRPLSLTLDELRRLGTTDLLAGFECSGNGPARVHGLVSNGRWTGLPLRDLLARAGVQADAEEVVFLGADRGEEQVEFRGRTFPVIQQFGRSLSVANATRPEPFIAHALNGEPLTRQQGFPARLVVPGWYGVANVKWLSDIHVQQDRYLGKFQARWYRTLQGETIDGEVTWKESEVSRLQLKSVIARVTRAGDDHQVVGFVLNDGTPLQSVEVQVDGGPWREAVLDAANTRFSWKLFSYRWTGATPGEHTIVSRVIDATGRVQPTAADLESKLTFLENNAQFPEAGPDLEPFPFRCRRPETAQSVTAIDSVLRRCRERGPGRGRGADARGDGGRRLLQRGGDGGGDVDPALPGDDEAARKADRRPACEALIDDERRQVRSLDTGMERVGPVERQRAVDLPRLLPRVARGQQAAPDVARGRAVRVAHGGEVERAGARRPDHVERRRRPGRADLAIEPARVRAQQHLRFGQGRRALLQHDPRPAAARDGRPRGALIPVVLEAEIGGRDGVRLQRRAGRRAERSHDARQVVRRRQAVADEEHPDGLRCLWLFGRRRKRPASVPHGHARHGRQRREPGPAPRHGRSRAHNDTHPALADLLDDAAMQEVAAWSDGHEPFFLRAVILLQCSARPPSSRPSAAPASGDARRP